MAKQIFLPSDGPVGTPSLRTLGTGALQAGAGNDSRFSDARTPTAHASTHDVGGADVLKDLTRLAAGPAINGYIAWAFDPENGNLVNTPTAGTIFLTKIETAHAYTINAVDLGISTAGTGVTPLANCFVGIYDSGGTRRFLSADQSSSFATGGSKSIAVSGGYVTTANDFIYLALLVGTQSTTTVKMFGGTGNSVIPNINLAAAALRFASNLTSQSSLPSSLTLSSNVAIAGSFWFGVK